MWITSAVNHGAAGGISERKRTSCSRNVISNMYFWYISHWLESWAGRRVFRIFPDFRMSEGVLTLHGRCRGGSGREVGYNWNHPNLYLHLHGGRPRLILFGDDITKVGNLSILLIIWINWYSLLHLGGNTKISLSDHPSHCWNSKFWLNVRWSPGSPVHKNCHHCYDMYASPLINVQRESVNCLHTMPIETSATAPWCMLVSRDHFEYSPSQWEMK